MSDASAATASAATAPATELPAEYIPAHGGGRLHPWRKGKSGNPSGLPSRADHPLLELRALAREHTPRAIARLAELLESPHGATALGAARELMDRGYGRPVQPVVASGEAELERVPLPELAARAATLLAELDGAGEPSAPG